MNQLNRAILLFTLTLGHAWAAGFEGTSNTTLGQFAGASATDDRLGTFIGNSAGFANTSGIYNTFIGSAAGFANTTGGNNTFLGRAAGYENATGGENTFLGSYAGRFNSTGRFNTFVGKAAGFNNTTSGANTFVGEGAGFSNTTGGHSNTFLGRYAGYNNTTAIANTYLGSYAGNNNTTGYSNTFVGSYTGYSNTTGYNNTFLGMYAGHNNTNGFGNVFLGSLAGFTEYGSNKLYIANDTTSTPLIYGDFGSKRLTINGNLEVIGPDFGIVELSDNKTGNTTKAARLFLTHYNNVGNVVTLGEEPVYLFGAASTATQNFVAFGGGNVIGNAATQLDFFTATNNTTLAGTPRMTITGNGNVGIGIQSPSHPLQMASGALVTTGGVWTNASSRDYKENIKDLSTKEASLTLASLTPVTYNYKVDKGQGHVGFIAEDVPELVATKNRKGLSPMDIVAVLTKVAQEQQRAIEEQQKTMGAYEKRAGEQQKIITELSTKLKNLKQEVRMGRTTALAD